MAGRGALSDPARGGRAAIGPRVVVGGVSGSGKSTLARELARRLDAPYIELDAHFHRPGWTSAGDDEFAASVRDALAAAGERWVVDGNYTRIREVTWRDATTFVWLDYPRGVATWRAVRRTVPRLVRRVELWHGNRERLRNLFSSTHPIWWSWHHHGTARQNYEAAVADPRWAHVEVVRLRTPGATRKWLAALLLAATLAACGNDATPAGPTPSPSSPSATTTPSPTPTPAPTLTPSATALPTDLANGKHYARLTAFDPAARTITVDVVQFLTGPQYDNDYTIKNENPRLRTLTFQAGLAVVVNTLTAEETGDSTKDTTITYDRLAAFLAKGEVQDRLFWFTVQDGVVTVLHEQYLP